MEVSTIGLDLAKNVFQAHGADAASAIVFSKRLRRHKVLEFFAKQPACLVAMEACASAHHWSRAHRRPLGGLTDRLGISGVVLLPFHKRRFT